MSFIAHVLHFAFRMCIIIGLLQGIAYANFTNTCSKFASTRPQGMRSCKLYLNEWNIDTIGGEKQFVELSKYCWDTTTQNSQVDIGKYKLLVISADGFLTTMFYSSIVKKGINKNELYFVFGGRDVSEGEAVDFLLENCQVAKSVFQTTGQYLPSGKDTPFALVLIYNKSPDPLKNLKLQKDGAYWEKKELFPNEIKTIITNLQDLYVTGSKTPFVYCNLFTKLLSKYTDGNDYVIRDWHTTNENDLSISRCSDSKLPFAASSMVYSTPTPNKINTCDNAFILRIENQLPLLPNPTSVQVGNNPDNKCFIINSEDAILNLGTITEQQEFVEHMEIAAEETIDYEMEDLDHQNHEHTGKDKEFDIDLSAIPNGLNSQFIWSDCSSFNEDWKRQIRDDINIPLDLNRVLDDEVCFWLEIFKPQRLNLPKMRCKLCNALINNKIITQNPAKLPKIFSEGYMKTRGNNRKFHNHNQIKLHKESSLHKISLQYFESIDKKLRGKNLKLAMMKKDTPYYNHFEATENLIILVYQSVQASLSFNNFEILTETLKHFNVDIGNRFQNAEGMRTVLMHISSKMHRKLVNYLLLNKPPLCVVLDSSTDIEGLQSLAVLFNTIDLNNRPKTYFYKLLDLPKGESGKSIFSAFKTSLQEDGLDQYFKRYLTGCTVDGCSSMNSTFRNELTEFTSYKYVHCHCQAHRYELVVKNAIKPLEVIKTTETLVNTLHAFLGPNSPKKKRILEETAVILNDTRFSVKRMQPIRWSASKFRALDTIVKHWYTILGALKRIVVRKREFTPNQIQTCGKLIQLLETPYIISTLAFVTDITRLFKVASEHLQIRGSTLIDKKDMRVKLVGDLEILREVDGTSLSEILSKSSYSYGPQPVTLQMFENEPVRLEQIRLRPPNPNTTVFNLSRNRNLYIDRLLFEIDKYFPETDVTDNFFIFDCSNWPKHSFNMTNVDYGSSYLKEMNTALEWGFVESELLRDWKLLIVSLNNDENFEDMCQKSPEEFYGYYLGNNECQISWTENTKQLLRTVLSIQATSAEAERVFGMYCAQKTKRRYSLKVSTVDAITRLRFNGEKSLSKLDAFEYAKTFSLDHSLADATARTYSSKILNSAEPHYLSIFEKDDILDGFDEDE